MIPGSAGLNSEHVLPSPGCQDLTERAKDNCNNVGRAGGIAIQRSRGNGVLRTEGTLTRLPAGSRLLLLIRNRMPAPASVFAAGTEHSEEATLVSSRRNSVWRALLPVMRRMREWKDKAPKESTKSKVGGMCVWKHQKIHPKQKE